MVQPLSAHPAEIVSELSGSAGSARPAAPDHSAAAFFDVDNTIMVGASMFHFAKGLAARDFFSWQDLMRFAVRQTRLRVRGETQKDLHHARESALAFVAGKSVAEIVELGEEIYDEELADKIWAGTLALARTHLDAGQRVWVVTATPMELASVIARRLELTGALVTVAESVDGIYTGHLVGEVLLGVGGDRPLQRVLGGGGPTGEGGDIRPSDVA